MATITDTTTCSAFDHEANRNCHRKAAVVIEHPRFIEPFYCCRNCGSKFFRGMVEAGFQNVTIRSL